MREQCVLLKRTQKNARTLRSFEKNVCPTLVTGVNIFYGVQLWGVLVDSDVALTVGHCVTGVNIFYGVQLWRGPGGP